MAEGGAIREGVAFVELSVRDTRLTQGLTQAAAKLKAFSTGLSRIGGKVSFVGAASLTPIVPALETLGEQSKLASIADPFGLTIEKASRLLGLLKSVGGDLCDATEGLVPFNTRISDALNRTGEEAAKLFRQLGVSAREYADLDTADRFYKLLEALRDVADPALRVQLLLKAIGEDTGKNLIPLVSMTAEELRELGGAFEQSGGELQRAPEANPG